MHKTLTLLLALAISLAATAQEIKCSWSGKIAVGGMQLNLVFNVTGGGDGKLSCTLDSPDQGAKGIPAEITVENDTVVKINIASLMAKYEGVLRDGMIKGTFTQGGMSLPLDLKPGAEAPDRPQTPVAPYPYATEEVTFKGGGGDVALSGTITYPEGFDKAEKGSTPVVVMVTGSGQQDRDETVFSHKPFLVIADYLARHGIASLRYDDRGAGKSTGSAADVTMESNMEDAAAAMDFARKTGKFGKAGVLGHSEGGAIAFMMAARGKADFIVCLAAPGVSGAELLTAQNRAMLTLSGVPAKMADDYCKAFKETLETLAGDGAGSSPGQIAHEAVQRAGVQLPDGLEANLAEVAKQCTPWMKSLISYDPSADIGKAECPVMAINGGKDTQVDAATNIAAIKRLLPQGGSNVAKVYDGLNHLFQHCTTGLPTEYNQIDETIAPAVLHDMAEWINKVK